MFIANIVCYRFCTPTLAKVVFAPCWLGCKQDGVLKRRLCSSFFATNCIASCLSLCFWLDILNSLFGRTAHVICLTSWAGYEGIDEHSTTAIKPEHRGLCRCDDISQHQIQIWHRDFLHTGCTHGTSNDSALHRKQGSVWCQSQRTCAKGWYDWGQHSLEPLTIYLQHAKWHGIDQSTNDVFFSIDDVSLIQLKRLKKLSDWKHANKFILSNSTFYIYMYVYICQKAFLLKTYSYFFYDVKANCDWFLFCIWYSDCSVCYDLLWCVCCKIFDFYCIRKQISS